VDAPPLIQVVYGTTRQGRFSQKVGGWLLDRLDARDDMAVELVDLRDYPLPVYERRIPPARALRDYPDPEIARWGATVDRADGYVFVTAEYNHGYPATLKNAIDHIFCEFQRKPAAFVGYGNVGAARAIEQLRLVCVELEMAPLRHAVHVLPDMMRPIMTVDTVEPDHFASLDPRLELLATDLAWWATALREARSRGA
jgi:NAD(P)H-dependent FMN reductase